MTEAKPWEIWWAYVAFEDEPDGKRRPVLVLENGEIYAIALKITSHEARNIWGEYEIVQWKTAGLSKPSTIRVTRRLRLRNEDLDEKIGDLQLMDIANLKRYL